MRVRAEPASETAVLRYERDARRAVLPVNDKGVHSNLVNVHRQLRQE